LTKYLEVDQEEPKEETTSPEKTHETQILGDLDTIVSGFSGEGSSASKRKRNVRAVMSLDTRRFDQSIELSLCFTNSDLEDVFPHEDDPVVISVITVGRKVPKVLIDQGSSADILFWETFANLQISLDQLKPYDGCLVSFADDQAEVRGYLELRTTFFDDSASRTITVKYIVVNTSSVYNLLLGRPSLNRLGAMASTTHMKMKLPSSEGGIITIKADQKMARKSYKSSLKNRRGTYTVVIHPGELGWVVEANLSNER